MLSAILQRGVVEAVGEIGINWGSREERVLGGRKEAELELRKNGLGIWDSFDWEFTSNKFY